LNFYPQPHKAVKAYTESLAFSRDCFKENPAKGWLFFPLPFFSIWPIYVSRKYRRCKNAFMLFLFTYTDLPPPAQCRSQLSRTGILFLSRYYTFLNLYI